MAPIVSSRSWYAYRRKPALSADHRNTSGKADRQGPSVAPNRPPDLAKKGQKSSLAHRNHGAAALTGLSIGWVTQEACRQRETGGQISKPMPAKQAPESSFCRNNSVDTQNGQFAAAPAQDAVFS
jgi:hypothetical protein